ncbi:MAG TPA: Tad domain-containing protein [Phycisphaerae bacterium]|nr:Tad domain-containing protein [Phycisphaerae bacterium]
MKRHACANRRPLWSRARCRARCGGQVLLITLLAMTLLVGLIFYVFNVGSAVNERLALQHVADSSVISAAGWMARSMNVVAMNNCAQSRMLALVPIMDSLPLASQMAHDEVAAWEKCLADQLRRPVNERTDNRQLLWQGMESLRSRMAEQRDILHPMDQGLNHGSFDMARTTTWQVPGAAGSGPHGEMWQAAVSLDAFSRATCESAGLFAQMEAKEYAERNGARAGFVVPIMPRMPAVRGNLSDFQPVLQGRQRVTSNEARFQRTGGNGGAIPDGVFPHRLGPWARLFRWRYEYRRANAWEWVPPRGGMGRTRGGRGNVSLRGRRVGASARQSRSGRPGYWRSTSWEVAGYHTYGPYHWAMQRINWHTMGWEGRWGGRPGELRDTYFYEYMRRLSDIKLGYMFGSKSLRTIHEPNWVVDYSRAQELAHRNEAAVNRTMFYLVEIASSVPEGDSRWLTPGTFRTNGDRPIAIWARGFVDTQDTGRWPIPKIGDYIWKDKYTYETTYDHEIGIRQVTDASGQPVWQPVYMVAWYIWGGIDVGGDKEVSNPCNWADERDLPAPWLLDTRYGDYDPTNLDPDAGVRRDLFSFLGVALKGHRAPVWPQRFSRPSMDNTIATVAQAKLFNHSSWDLWTQDWQVQLTPVGQWSNWVLRLERGLDDVSDTQGLVSEDDARFAWGYFARLEPLADTWVNH